MGTSLDASTKLLLVVATDGEENSSAGECGGEEWREKVAEKVEATSPRINMNMNVFGKLDEINVGIAASSSISSTSLSYFSNLSESSGGFAMFVDDNSSELPKFFNMFPNEKKFINQLQLSREDVTPWKVPTVDNSLGYKNLLINESALKGIKNRIDAFKNPSTKVKDDWRIDRLNKVQPIKYSPLKIDKWVRPTKADLHFKESAIKDAQTILKKLPQKF
ncbi:MAG: hypothetical protein EOP04_14710 [Proteobacteria bacterium]|nr:MAG: hypothetical protein EOP04_14710 [Pseudomonadota bacterium]